MSDSPRVVRGRYIAALASTQRILDVIDAEAPSLEYLGEWGAADQTRMQGETLFADLQRHIAHQLFETVLLGRCYTCGKE